MGRVVIGVGVFGLLVGLAGCGSNPAPADPGPPPVEWSADMQAVADGQNRFALDLYTKLAADKASAGKNVFFSPYSVHTALAMTASGAKGNTRDEMLKVLHLPDATVLASGDIGRYYGHPRKDFELSVANALWGRKGFPWRAEWLKEQNERFGAGFHEADFATQADAERQRINRWVEEQTREKIKELLQQGQIGPKTTIVLTNAIYFKGNWAEEFDPKKTRNVPFTCDDGTKVDVPMMNAELKCRLASVDGVRMAELPYRGDELAMLVALPKESEKLADLEKALTPEQFAKWVAGLHEANEFPVSIPKFKIETRYELPEHLQALGMKAAFGGADFTGMATSPPGWITSVTHKALVEVNEEGTEAAAATAVVIGESARMPFTANRPFLFFIRDVNRGTILFMGRVAKP